MNTSYLGIPKSKDIDQRTRRYLINMSIRMACLILLLVVPGWWKLICLIGAALLPMLAVMLANDQAIPKPVTNPQVDFTPKLAAIESNNLAPLELKPLKNPNGATYEE